MKIKTKSLNQSKKSRETAKRMEIQQRKKNLKAPEKSVCNRKEASSEHLTNWSPKQKHKTIKENKYLK